MERFGDLIIVAILTVFGIYSVSCSITFLLPDLNGIKILKENITAKNTSVVLYIQHSETDFTSVDFNLAQQTIFWYDMNSEIIYSFSLKDEIKRQVIRIPKAGDTINVAVDWIEDDIYWTSGIRTIEACKINGQNRTVLIKGMEKSPSLLTLHPFLRVMFWANKGKLTAETTIEKSAMDGRSSSREIIIKSGINSANDIEIDFTTERLFWSTLDFIESSDFDGNGIKQHIQATFLANAGGLAITSSYLYWWDNAGKIIAKSPQPNFEKIEYIKIPLQNSLYFSPLNDLDVMSDEIQPQGNLLIVSTVTGLEKYLLDSPKKSRKTVKDTPISSGSKSLAADPIAGNVFVLDTFNNIRKMDFDGDGDDVVVDLSEVNDCRAHHCSFSLDWNSRKLYLSWKEITVVSVDRSFDTFRLDISNMEMDHDRTYSLCVDPFFGFIYFLTTSADRKLVNRVNDNGKNYKIIYSTTKDILTLTVDYSTSKVYYIVGTMGFWGMFVTIVEMNPDGTNRHDLSHLGFVYPTSMAIYDDNIYYLDTAKNIRSVNKTNGHKKGTLDSSGLTNPLSTVFVKYNKDIEEETACSGIRKCWGRSNKWLCLTPEMVCNGFPDCYHGYDEMLCNICSESCQLRSIYFSCQEMATSKTFDGVNEFVKWDQNFLSNFIQLRDIFQYDCHLSFSVEVNRTDDRHSEELIDYEIHSLFLLHKLRQLVLSNIFSDLKFVRNFVLSGFPLFLANESISNSSLNNFVALRELEISYTQINVLQTTFLQSLFNLQILRVIMNVHLTLIEERSFLSLSSLRELVISENKLSKLTSTIFDGLNGLRKLIVSGKFITLVERHALQPVKKLEVASITKTSITDIPTDLFENLENLRILNLSMNGIRILKTRLFQSLKNLQIIDIRGNDMYFDGLIFKENKVLEVIFSDSYTFCCVKPPSVLQENCFAPPTISDCESLIQNNKLRILLWIIGLIALFGNACVIIFHIKKGFRDKNISIFVVNLAIVNCVTGIYITTIAAVDNNFKGSFAFHEYTWRHSIICGLIGFLAMFCNELSVLFVALITVEMFFTFGNRGSFTISKTIVIIIVLAAWTIALLLAFLPMILYDDFYSQSNICITLPVSGKQPIGFGYSVSVYLGINIMAFVFVIIGQIDLFLKMKVITGSHETKTTAEHESAVYQRLSLIILTDILSWLAVGNLILVSMFGISISRDVYSWFPIFVLPLNSALNPILYAVLTVVIKKIEWQKETTEKQQGSNSKISRAVSFVETEVIDITSNRESFKLRSYLQDCPITVSKMFLLIRMVTEELESLHGNGLVCEGMTDENIYINVENGKFKSVNLEEMKTDRSNTTTVFHKDMEDLGLLIKQLLSYFPDSSHVA